MARATSNRRSRRRRPKGEAAQTPAVDTAGAGAAIPDSVDASSATVPAPQTLLRPRRETPRPLAPTEARPRRRFRIWRPQIIADIVSELRKVVWPTRAETANLTLVVIMVAVAVGILLGVVDWGFSRILENVLLP
jgi:preprotein translocase subunit SecE